MSKFNKKVDSDDKRKPNEERGKGPRRGASNDTEKKSYKAKRSFTKNKSYRDKKGKPDEKRRKPFKQREGERSGDYAGAGKKNYTGPDDKRPFKKEVGRDRYENKPRRDFDDRNDRPSPKAAGRPERTDDRTEKGKSFKKVYKKKDDKFSGFKKAAGGYDTPRRPDTEDKPAKRRFTKPRKEEEGGSSKRVKYDEFEEGRAFAKQESYVDRKDKKSGKKVDLPKTNADGLMRLNKYLSNAGVASRRDADNLILSGAVKVNGVVVDKLGSKISPTDKVTYGDSAVRTERKVYLLLNKPKDYITTLDDPKDRKTVMELIAGACRERIYPVGRLDRNTTGLLLFTNDGELTTKLTHPKFGVKKVYHVSLNKGLKPDDFKAIVEGVELEDGLAKADDLAFVGEGKKEVGIEIHSGRNRIVRRIFEHLGYDVLKLDRVVFAGLTKKDLPRGKHRFLTGKEISFLQMIG
jgi:23S rRNA pseudouridine2605 synthase